MRNKKGLSFKELIHFPPARRECDHGSLGGRGRNKGGTKHAPLCFLTLDSFSFAFVFTRVVFGNTHTGINNTPDHPLSSLPFPPLMHTHLLSKLARWASGHLYNFHAARKASLLADFAQVFPRPALWQGLLKFHLAAPPLELLLSGGVLVPAVAPVSWLPSLLVSQSDFTACLDCAAAERRIGAGAGKESPAPTTFAAWGCVCTEVPGVFWWRSARGFQVHPPSASRGWGCGWLRQLLSYTRKAQPKCLLETVLHARAFMHGTHPTKIKAQPMGGRACLVPVLPPLSHFGLKKKIRPIWPVRTVWDRRELACTIGTGRAVQLT